MLFSPEMKLPRSHRGLHLWLTPSKVKNLSLKEAAVFSYLYHSKVSCAETLAWTQANPQVQATTQRVDSAPARIHLRP